MSNWNRLINEWEILLLQEEEVDLLFTNSEDDELQQNGKMNLFHVYPNPAKDILHVETNGNATVSLINQSGKILVTTNIDGKGVINISGIAAGLYYLKNNSIGKIEKVVVER